MQNQNVLIVDDDELFLKSVDRAFKFESFNMITAATGKDAIELCDFYKFSLIISDYRMPDMNGLEFLKKVRVLHPHIVLIMLTAVSDINVAVQAINKIGIFKFILKPVKFSLLKDSVYSALSYYNQDVKYKDTNEIIKSKDVILKELELNFPGISSMPPRDKDGYIILET